MPGWLAAPPYVTVAVAADADARAGNHISVACYAMQRSP
jgi:hypothetical protein